MSENLNDLNNQKTNLLMQGNEKKEILDIEKYNTYSNNKIDENKKSNFGLNEVLDVGKYNSKSPIFEKETKERRNLVDQLFDESINHDMDKIEENIFNLDINKKINDNLINNDDNKQVHLFTESAHEQSIRDSDLFGFNNKFNADYEVNKNSNSLFNLNNNMNSDNINLNTKINENSDNFYKKQSNNNSEINFNINDFGEENKKNQNLAESILSTGKNEAYQNLTDNIPAYAHKTVPAYKNINTEEKNHFISRLFSDNIYTENEYSNNINDSINKSNNNLLNNNKIDSNNRQLIKNPFDDTEDNIQISQLSKNDNNNEIKMSNSNPNDRISFNNPNFIVSNINDVNNNEINHNYRESGNNILSRFNEKPFKSINFAENNLDGNLSKEENENINLNNFNSFNDNSKYINSLRENKVEINNNHNNTIIRSDNDYSRENFENKNKEESNRSNVNVENNIKNTSELDKFNNSQKNLNLENIEKIKKTSKDEIGDFNLFGGDDSKEEISLEKKNSFKNNKISSNNNNKNSSTTNILDEIDIEIDNDKLNEENNFNFNLGLTNNSIKNYNDLEIKNKIDPHHFNNVKTFEKINNTDISNFNSKDFKNFEFNSNNKNQVKQQGMFFDDNFDFETNSKKDINLTKANNPKLEIKLNNINNKKTDSIKNNENEIINANFDMFKNLQNSNTDNNQINSIPKNFDFEQAANNTKQEKNINFNNPYKVNLKINSIGLSNNVNNNNNNFNFEIKNNPNNVNNNFHSSLPINSSKIISNGDFYNDGMEEDLLGKESKNKNPTAEEIMQKNQNINFDKIIFDVFDKNEKTEKNKSKQKVRFDKEYESEFINNDSKNNILPADYVNLDDFQSGKMNEYNNNAVNKNLDNLIDINFKDYENENGIKDEKFNNNIPNIEDSDSLYMESKRDEEYLHNNGIFNRYNEKFEKPFGKISNLNNKKTDYLKRKNKITNDNLISNEKSFAKINHNLNFNSKKYFSYDSEVLISQIEALFLDLFQNYDFDQLKKKLKNTSKDLKLRCELKVSYLQSINNFKINSDLININSAKFKILETNAKYIREIKSDGNGFYRTFMFSIIENFILNENTLGLRNILNDINELIDLSLSNNIEVNKYEVIGIFNCILENLDTNDIGNAYSTFLNAYGFSVNFDNVIHSLKNFVFKLSSKSFFINIKKLILFISKLFILCLLLFILLF